MYKLMTGIIQTLVKRRNKRKNRYDTQTGG